RARGLGLGDTAAPGTGTPWHRLGRDLSPMVVTAARPPTGRRRDEGPAGAGPSFCLEEQTLLGGSPEAVPAQREPREQEHQAHRRLHGEGVAGARQGPGPDRPTVGDVVV